MKTRSVTKKKSALEFNPDRMITELEQLVVDRTKADLSKYRITQINATPVHLKTADEILGLRERKLNMSRGAFAKVLNVPQATLRAWEIGKRHPSGAAVRLLDLMDQKPEIAFEIACLRQTSPWTDQNKRKNRKS